MGVSACLVPYPVPLVTISNPTETWEYKVVKVSVQTLPYLTRGLRVLACFLTEAVLCRHRHGSKLNSYTLFKLEDDCW